MPNRFGDEPLQPKTTVNRFGDSPAQLDSGFNTKEMEGLSPQGKLSYIQMHQKPSENVPFMSTGGKNIAEGAMSGSPGQVISGAAEMAAPLGIAQLAGEAGVALAGGTLKSFLTRLTVAATTGELSKHGAKYVGLGPTGQNVAGVVGAVAGGVGASRIGSFIDNLPKGIVSGNKWLELAQYVRGKYTPEAEVIKDALKANPEKLYEETYGRAPQTQREMFEAKGLAQRVTTDARQAGFPAPPKQPTIIEPTSGPTAPSSHGDLRFKPGQYDAPAPKTQNFANNSSLPEGVNPPVVTPKSPPPAPPPVRPTAARFGTSPTETPEMEPIPGDLPSGRVPGKPVPAAPVESKVRPPTARFGTSPVQTDDATPIPGQLPSGRVPGKPSPLSPVPSQSSTTGSGSTAKPSGVSKDVPDDIYGKQASAQVDERILMAKAKDKAIADHLVSKGIKNLKSDTTPEIRKAMVKEIAHPTKPGRPAYSSGFNEDRLDEVQKLMDASTLQKTSTPAEELMKKQKLSKAKTPKATPATPVPAAQPAGVFHYKDTAPSEYKLEGGQWSSRAKGGSESDWTKVIPGVADDLRESLKSGELKPRTQ